VRLTKKNKDYCGSNVSNKAYSKTKEKKQGLITRTLMFVRSNSLAETVSMVWASANTDNSEIFGPKVKAHSEEDYEPSSRRPPQTTTRQHCASAKGGWSMIMNS